MGNLVDSSLLDSLGFLFEQRCTIQRKTKGRSTSGEVTETWVDLSGHVSIPCVISNKSKGDGSPQELTRRDGTHTMQIFKAMLQGCYPTVTTEDRMTSEGKTYEIKSVLTDSQNVMTTLQVVIDK